MCFYALNKIGAISNYLSVLSSEDEIKKFILEGNSQVVVSVDLFGKKVLNATHDTNVRNGIQELRDVMAALRWELMEEYSEVTKRKSIHLSDFDKEKEEIIREYPPLDWEYEESVIYKK